MQHRLVAERMLGRHLTGVEVVHHEDEDPANNHPSNLWLFPSQADHIHHHQLKRALQHDPELARALEPLAADHRTTYQQAAEELGCSIPAVRALCENWGIEWTSAQERQLDEPMVREALRGRTTLEAANALGVNHQTLRRRFPHLLVKRASPGFLNAHREEIRSLATRQRVGEIAERFGCCRVTVSNAIHQWAKEEPDAWSDALAFQRSRRGIRWSKKRKA